jgi:hypothetical protein
MASTIVGGFGDHQPAMIVLPSATAEDDPNAHDGCGTPPFVSGPRTACPYWRRPVRPGSNLDGFKPRTAC